MKKGEREVQEIRNGAEKILKNDVERLIDIKEAATEFHLKVSYLRGLVFRNKIPFYKVGGLVRFDRQEINCWMRAQRVPAIGESGATRGKTVSELFEIDTRFNTASNQ